MAIVQVEEAIEMLTGVAQPITETERVGLLEASGRVLAEDITGIQDQPPFPRSPLDGYAVKGAETLAASKERPVKLKVIGKICAGEVFSGTVRPGECIRIMTGAPIPDGADTVIRQEDTSYADMEAASRQEGSVSACTDREIKEEKSGLADTGYVSIYKGSEPYRNYCYAGEDYKKGDILIDRGRVMEGRHIAIIAGTGREEVEVFRKPEIAVISTGDEVIAPGQPWRAGKIYDANRYYVCGRLKDMGMDHFTSSHCPDKVAEMCGKLLDAAEKCDLIITTGGVSVGEKDIMHQVYAELAGGVSNGPAGTDDHMPNRSGQQTDPARWTARKLFYRVRLKPGSPTLAFTLTRKDGSGPDKGEAREVLVICLTGNPYGVVVNFELLVRPVIAVLTGNEQIKMKKMKCLLENDSPKRGGRRFLRAYMKESPADEPQADALSAEGDNQDEDRKGYKRGRKNESGEGAVCRVSRVRIIAGSQQSGTISSLDKSNCLVEIGPESTGYAGEQVWVYL